MIVAELTATLGLTPKEGEWEKGNQLIESLHHAIEAYLGYEGLQKVKELVEGTVEAAQEAKNLGEQLGITAEAVQELGYAAYVSDVSTGQLQSSMQRLSRGLEDVKSKGTGPTADALQKLGVHMRDLKGESLDQNIEVIADAFKNAGPEVNKTALAIELFGRSAGPRMLLLLNKGKEGIVDLRNEAQKLGFVMGEEALEKAEEFEVAQKKLHATLVGVRNVAVTAILPALTEMAEKLGKWVLENREAIASTLQAVLEGIATAFHLVGQAISVVLDIASYLNEHWEIMAALVTAAAAIIIPFVAEWAAGMIVAAAATLAAASPFIAIGVAVAALAYGIIKLIENWDEVWDAIKKGGEHVLDWFASLPGRFASWVGDVTDDIKQAFQDAWDYVVDSAHRAWEEIKDLPVIGHIIRGAQFLGGSIQDVAQQTMNTTPSVPGAGLGFPSSAANAFNATIGDTNIQIDATGMTPDELKDAVKDTVRDAHVDAYRQAFTNLGGGKR
jgi:hypothetical protein